MISIRPLLASEWEAYRTIRLRALADAPDAFGATLALAQAMPDATWKDRLSTGSSSPLQLPLVAECAGDLVGLAWGMINPDTLHIARVYQMWVAPECRSAGAGAALLNALVGWAALSDVQFVELSVTTVNTAAVRLYERAGFVSYGPSEVLRAESNLFAQPMRLTLHNSDSPNT